VSTWSPLASDQADDAVASIAAENPQAAREWLERLFTRVKTLTQYPDSGRVVPELQRDDVREILVAPYRVVYRRGAEVVEIAANIHGARDLEGDDLAR
jgi:toxin ParE1/3/4